MPMRLYPSEPRNDLAFRIAMRLAKHGVADPAYAATRILEDSEDNPSLLETLIRARIRLHKAAKRIDAKPKRKPGREAPATAKRRIRKRTESQLRRIGYPRKEAKETAAALVEGSLSFGSLKAKMEQLKQLQATARGQGESTTRASEKRSTEQPRR